MIRRHRPREPCVMPLDLMWEAMLCGSHRRAAPCPDCEKEFRRVDASDSDFDESGKPDI
jgi:hypothetical protein